MSNSAKCLFLYFCVQGMERYVAAVEPEWFRGSRDNTASSQSNIPARYTSLQHVSIVIHSNTLSQFLMFQTKIFS